MRWKICLQVIIGIAVYEIIQNVFFYFSLASLFPHHEPRALMFIIPVGAVCILAAFYLLKNISFSRIFLITWIAWESINYSYIYLLHTYPQLSGTATEIEKMTAALPVLYVLAPFGIIYWASALFFYVKQRKHSRPDAADQTTPS